MEAQKPTLVILAAGVGSRYGGLKQLDGVGPDGETIMEYSVFDAIRSGFGKVVFVIKEAHRSLFEQRLISRFGCDLEFSFAFQSLDDLPQGFSPVVNRTKPWGTGHAVRSARNHVCGPFAVINADDFYGPGAFRIMAAALQGVDSHAGEFFLVGYRLLNTLSRHGSVSRGLCSSRDGYLTAIKELTKVSGSGGSITYREAGKDHELDADTIISMNFWGFTPRIFDFIETGFADFLEQNEADAGAEYFLTEAVDDAIKSGQARVQLLTTDETWLGITYSEDKETVVKGIRSRIRDGFYPQALTDDRG